MLLNDFGQTLHILVKVFQFVAFCCKYARATALCGLKSGYFNRIFDANPRCTPLLLKLAPVPRKPWQVGWIDTSTVRVANGQLVS